MAEPNVTHVYTTPGTYTVTLTVRDNDMEEATKQIIVVAEEQAIPPVASFFASSTSGRVPFTVSFDASASYDPDGTIEAYIWDFGDGTVEET